MGRVARASDQSGVVELTAVHAPAVVYDGARGWGEDPALVVDPKFTYVTYAVTQGDGSHIYLARRSRMTSLAAFDTVRVDRDGEIEFWPSIARDGRGNIWVAWTSCRHGTWAVRAASITDMKVSRELEVSEPGGFQSRAKLSAGDGVLCFVWVAAKPGDWSIIARLYDGKLRKPFTVYDGSDPVGRPDVRVVARDHLVFVWDEYKDGQFIIRKTEMAGGNIGPVEILSGTPGSANWEPSVAGAGDSLVVAWSSVPADTVVCWPVVEFPGGQPVQVGIAHLGKGENWRVKCMSDAHGNDLIFWTTRFLYHSTNLYARRIGPKGVTRTCSIDFPLAKLFMNVFDCALDRSLHVVWDRSGSIYLGEVTPAELELAGFLGDQLRQPSEWASEGEPERREAAPVALSGEGDDYAVPDLVRSRGAVTYPKSAYSVFYRGESLHVYFGDYHNHTSFSDGRAYPDMSLIIARDWRHLDFAVVTDHDVTVTPGEFAWNAAVADILTDDDKFASLHGFEVSKGWAKAGFGHWNMLFRSDGSVLRFVDGMTPPDVYAFAKAHDALVIPHHVAKRFAPHDWDFADREAEPVVEMCSIHGIFENGKGYEGRRDMVPGKFVDDGLARGYVFGFVGGSDSHNCFMSGKQEWGITGVYAPSLSPTQIFDAMKQRRTFALTGGRTILDFRCNGQLMGEEIDLGEAAGGSAGPLVFTGYASSPDSIVSLEIVSDRETVSKVEGRSPEALIHWEAAAPDSQTYFYLRATTARGDLAWSSPIWIVPHR